MASISGTNLAAGVVPFTTEDTFPTHYSKYGAGGWHEVSTESDKDLIPEARRVVGMAVSVVETAKTYTLQEDGTWKEISADVDLSDYYTKTEVDTALNDKQNTLTAGTGISIVDNTISSTVTADVTSVNGKKGDVIVDSISDQHTSDMIKIWTGTKSEYAALTTKDPNTLYYVKKEGTPVDIYELLDDKQNKLVAGTSISLTSNEDGTVTIANVDPNVQSDWNADTGSAVILNKPTLAVVATSGSYTDLTNKPEIPTLPENITTQGNTFNGANQLVQLDENGKLPAIDGSQLTGINIPDVDVATTEKAGVVKPDGTTITITEDGTISSVGGTGGTSDYTALTNKPQINSVELSGNKTLDELGIQSKGDFITNTELEGKGYLTSAPVSSVNGEIGEIIVKTIQNSNDSSMYLLWVGTQEEYDAITEKDANTLYYVQKEGTPVDIYELLDDKQNKLVAGNGIELINNGDGTATIKSSNPVVELTDFSAIEADKVYKATITSAVTPVLPAITDSNTHRVIIYASIGAGGSITDFGTTYFYNSEKPVPAEGDTYDLVYVYNPVRASWVCNAIKINVL